MIIQLKQQEELNYDIIMWSIDTIDWREDSTKDKIINRVLTQVRKFCNSIDASYRRNYKSVTSNYSKLKEEGYDIVKVD